MLIIKLRSANTAETRQYKKATKALLVLIPLLGITYLVVLTVPKDDSVGSNLFTYLQAFLISTQVSWLNLVIWKSIMNLSLFHFIGFLRFATLLFPEFGSETSTAPSMGNLAWDTEHWSRCTIGISEASLWHQFERVFVTAFTHWKFTVKHCNLSHNFALGFLIISFQLLFFTSFFCLV